MQYGRLYPYDYPVFMENLFLTGYLSLYLLEILVLVYLITNIQALLMFTLLLPMLCLFLLLFVFNKHYGKKDFQQTLLKQYEQYKIENPKLRLIRFWAFVLGPFVLIFLSVVVS